MKAASANVVALVLAGAASLLLLVLPVYRSVSSSAALGSDSEPQAIVTTVSRATLLEINGPSVLLVLGIPVALTLIGLILQRLGWSRRWRLVPAILLTGFCILTGFSIGLFYLPTAAALWVAAVLPMESPRADGAVP